jgi:hypothetical protein
MKEPNLDWTIERWVVRVIHIGLLVYLLPAILVILLMLVVASVIGHLIDLGSPRGPAALAGIPAEGRREMVLFLIPGTLQAMAEGPWPWQVWSWMLGRPESWESLERAGIPAEILPNLPLANVLVAREQSVDQRKIEANLDWHMFVVQARPPEFPWDGGPGLGTFARSDGSLPARGMIPAARIVPVHPIARNGRAMSGVQVAGRRQETQIVQPTPEHWVRLEAFREEWFRVGTCTAPADRPRAEAAIVRMYAEVGAAPPHFLWCDSPMAAQLALSILGGRRSARRDALWPSLPPALRVALEDARRAAPLGVWMGDALRASGFWVQEVLGVRLGDALNEKPLTPEGGALMFPAWEDPRWGSRRAQALLETALTGTLSGSLRALKVAYRPTPLRGQQEADWIEFFQFYRDMVGICFEPPLSERLDGWADLARSCMWWWPYSGICVISERPAEIHTSDGQRLHNDAGPAVRFRDDWSIWAIDGVLVDEQVVLHPETQTIPQIRRERHAEAQRIRIERYGWDRYLAGIGARVIDRRRNDIEATRETLLRGPDRQMFLVCACPSTARVHTLRVPPEIRTCEGAQTWLSGGLAGRIINAA